MKDHANLLIFGLLFSFLFSCNTNQSFQEAADAIKNRDIKALETALSGGTPDGVDENGNSLYHLAVLNKVKPSFYELLSESDVKNMTVKNAEGLDPMELALKNANNSGIIGLLKVNSWEVDNDSVYIRKVMEDDKATYFVVQLTDAHLIARDESNDQIEIRLVNSLNGKNLSIEGFEDVYRQTTSDELMYSFSPHDDPSSRMLHIIEHPMLGKNDDKRIQAWIADENAAVESFDEVNVLFSHPLTLDGAEVSFDHSLGNSIVVRNEAGERLIEYRYNYRNDQYSDEIPTNVLDTAIVTAKRVELCSQIGPYSPIGRFVEENEIVEILELGQYEIDSTTMEGVRWVKVEGKGKAGWLKSNYLTKGTWSPACEDSLYLIGGVSYDLSTKTYINGIKVIEKPENYQGACVQFVNLPTVFDYSIEGCIISANRDWLAYSETGDNNTSIIYIYDIMNGKMFLEGSSDGKLNPVDGNTVLLYGELTDTVIEEELSGGVGYRVYLVKEVAYTGGKKQYTGNTSRHRVDVF